MVKLSSLTRERREGKAALTLDENGEVRTEEIKDLFPETYRGTLARIAGHRKRKRRR